VNNPFKILIKMDEVNVFKAKCKDKDDIVKQMEDFLKKLQ
jgi:hypothetical protein